MIEAGGNAPARLVWSVGALVLAVADTLATRFSACAVRGEISGFSRAASGHIYFNLKDADGGAAMLRCAMFRRAAGLLDFTPADGQLVELRGRIVVYEQRGELQIVVEAMRRAGAGALYEQFLRLRQRLEAEGLFDPSRRRPLPPHPRRIGVVTSLGAAALRDVLTSFARRAPHVGVVVYPSLVQGADAPAALVEAITAAGRRAEVDTLIVCRGGGSLEDLWAFNDERVVRAVAAAPLPVISGVGHETDVTLCDLAADLRAATPTAAAELATPATRASLEVLAARHALMRRRVDDGLGQHAQRLDRAALRLARPAEGVRRHAQHLRMLEQRLRSATGHGVERGRALLDQQAGRLARGASLTVGARTQRIASLEARLRTLDPRQVLTRGYAWLADADGHAVTSVNGLSPGARLRAELADGSAGVIVSDVTGAGAAPAKRAGRSVVGSSGRPPRGPEQGTLDLDALPRRPPADGVGID